jgi:hypothetical protein
MTMKNASIISVIWYPEEEAKERNDMSLVTDQTDREMG